MSSSQSYNGYSSEDQIVSKQFLQVGTKLFRNNKIACEDIQQTDKKK